MSTIQVLCPLCKSSHVVNYGYNRQNKQRYQCKNEHCKKDTFILDYDKKGYLPETQEKIVEMALNGSGVRDTARVLGVGAPTVIKVLKKRRATPKCESPTD